MADPKVRFDIEIIVNGEVVLNSDTARLLSEIKRLGSLLKASQSLGLPYSKAWDMINRAERSLGSKLVETWRGGGGKGGTRLTREAEKLLDAYVSAESRLASCAGPLFPRFQPTREPSLIIAYSHDHILELATGLLSNNYGVEAVCNGSLRSLAMLSLGEADIACAHLYEPESNSFNRGYLQKYYIEDPVLLGGFKREVVLAFRSDLTVSSVEEAVELLRRGKLRLVNRNPGSGTRLFLDYLLKKYGVKPTQVKGYNNAKYTHEEVVKEIALGRSDIGLTTRYYSELYGLNSISLIWERYECFTTRNKAGKKGVKAFEEVLNSSSIKGLIEKLPGYRLL